jgi:hypothetical protein
MKKSFMKISIPLVVLLLVFSSAATFVTAKTDFEASEKALTFIKNVLPIDTSKYNITLTSYFTDDGSPITGVTGEQINRLRYNVRYTLESKESTFDIICAIENNTVTYCQLTARDGQIIYDRQYANALDAAKSFLEKYQSYSTIDSTAFKSLLTNIDSTKDTTITYGDILFKVSNIDKYGVQQTSFKWANTINGAEYTYLQITFQNGGIVTFHDDRSIYTIGDTTVNISSEQANNIAMTYLKTYSYDMTDGSKVSNFNLTKERTTIELASLSTNSSVLRPYWNVKLYLNQTYPGSVQGFSVYIWANSGDVFSCTNIAYGGVDYPDGSDMSTSSSSADYVSSMPIENDSSQQGIVVPAVVLAAGLAFAITSVVMIKKRKK